MATSVQPRRAILWAVSIVSLVAIAACNRDAVRLSSHRFAPVGHARLVTQFYQTPVSGAERPLFHILFLPVVAPSPGSARMVSGSGGGSLEELSFQYSYAEQSWDGPKEQSIRSLPVYVRNLTTLETRGQSFSLANGSVFVGHVQRDGQVRMTQLPLIAQDEDPEPAVVLQAIRRQLPHDQHLHALPAE